MTAPDWAAWERDNGLFQPVPDDDNWVPYACRYQGCTYATPIQPRGGDDPVVFHEALLNAVAEHMLFCPHRPGRAGRRWRLTALFAAAAAAAGVWIAFLLRWGPW